MFGSSIDCRTIEFSFRHLPRCQCGTWSPTLTTCLDGVYSLVWTLKMIATTLHHAASFHLFRWSLTRQTLLTSIVVVQMVLNISGHAQRRGAEKFDCRRHFGMKTEKTNVFWVCTSQLLSHWFVFYFHERMFLPNTVSEMRKIIRGSKLQLLLP